MEIMNPHPTVSVVMSVYNGEALLEEAIGSILDQEFSNFEFIIIDDASSDRSPEIIRSCSEKDDRIRVFTNQENLGLTRSLNRGLEMARGEFIARQDADDISLSDRLKKQHECLSKNPGLCLAASAASIIDSQGNEIFPRPYSPDFKRIRSFLKRQNIIVHGSAFFRRTRILELGGYREHFIYAQDYDLWLRIMERCRITILPRRLYRIRISLDNLSMKKSLLQEEYARIARRFYHQRQKTGEDQYENFFEAFDPGEIETSGKQAEAKYHFLRAMYLLGEDKIGPMRKELAHSLGRRPWNPSALFYYAASLSGLWGINILRRLRDIIYKF